MQSNSFSMVSGGLGGITITNTYQGIFVWPEPTTNSWDLDTAVSWSETELDDSHGGDSIGDGTASSPAAGDWDGIYISSLKQNWATILYD